MKQFKAYIAGDALRMGVTTSNVPMRKQIDRETMISLLNGNIADFDKWRYHLNIFFNEVHPCLIVKIAVDYRIPIRLMAVAFFKLPKKFQHDNFLCIYNAVSQYGLEAIWEEKDGKCCLTMP